jgi:two-component system cell cycle response regulator DivK
MDARTKLLIVDDDSRNIFALKAVLKMKGFDCITALSGQEGIKYLADDKDIKIVLLDMMMPDMDGYETINVIRSSSRKAIPIISVTAQAMVGDREKCLEAGADDYIAKPIDVEKLVVIIKQYLP